MVLFEYLQNQCKQLLHWPIWAQLNLGQWALLECREFSVYDKHVILANQGLFYLFGSTFMFIKHVAVERTVDWCFKEIAL